MSFNRPTFHESWHRVADMRPRLRPSVQSRRQHYRGRTWHVLTDPASGQYFRIDEASYRLVGLLDGRRTVATAWDHVCTQMDEQTPTQGETIQLLGQLYTHNLLEADLPPDTRGLFERQRKRVRREVGSYAMNILFAKFPLFDPDRLLDRWVPLVGWIFGPVGILGWIVLMVMGVRALLGQWGALADQAQAVLSPGNLGWLYVSLVGIKAIHEAGHAFAAKHFGRKYAPTGGKQGEGETSGGGEVHTIGIMLMVFTPVPYVDATSSWAIRRKWVRAFIAAAGMYVELAVAAVAAIVWTQTAPGTALHAVAYNLIFIAGVSTILFNANPLIKFDGYFILSDILEAPNLYQRSQRYLGFLCKRFLYGVRNPHNPAHSAAELPWLIVYGLASMAYKIFLAVVIALFVADKLFIVGVLMALLAIVTFLGVPVGKLIKYLLTSPELARVRPRALITTGLAVGIPIAALALIPAPQRPRAAGVVQAEEMAYVHAGSDGELVRILPTGTYVHPKESGTLFLARNAELDAELERLLADRRRLEAQYRLSRREGALEKQIVEQQLLAVEDMIDRVREQRRGLAAYSPIEGTWISAVPEGISGSYVRRGDALGYVATLDHLLIRVVADQFQGPALAQPGATVSVRVRGDAGTELRGVVTQVLPAGRRRLPSRALGQAGGGEIAVDPTDERGDLATEPFFEIVIKPDVTPSDDALSRLKLGQRVVVRFELPDRPLLGQWVRQVRQVLQRRFSV